MSKPPAFRLPSATEAVQAAQNARSERVQITRADIGGVIPNPEALAQARRLAGRWGANAERRA